MGARKSIIFVVLGAYTLGLFGMQAQQQVQPDSAELTQQDIAELNKNYTGLIGSLKLIKKCYFSARPCSKNEQEKVRSIVKRTFKGIAIITAIIGFLYYKKKLDDAAKRDDATRKERIDTFWGNLVDETLRLFPDLTAEAGQEMLKKQEVIDILNAFREARLHKRKFEFDHRTSLWSVVGWPPRWDRNYIENAFNKLNILFATFAEEYKLPLLTMIAVTAAGLELAQVMPAQNDENALKNMITRALTPDIVNPQ